MNQTCIDWLSTGPELLLLFAAPPEFILSPERRTACRQNISRITSKIFEKHFGIQIAIPASIDEESIRIRVKPRLESLPPLLHASAQQTVKNRYLAADIRHCWEQLAQVSKKVMAAENQAIQAERIEQIQGAVERLDALSFACEKKGQWEDIDLAEAKSNLSIIYFCRTRDELVPAMNAYFDTKYPSDGKQRQTGAAQQPSFDFLSGLLQEEERRRQNEISNKIRARSTIE